MNEEEAVEKVLRRAEISRITRHLKSRLALASFKTKRGWESLALDSIEPRINEELSTSASASQQQQLGGGPDDIQSSPLRKNMYSNFSSPPGELQSMEFLEPPVEFTRKRAKTLPSNATINVTFHGVEDNKENTSSIRTANGHPQNGLEHHHEHHHGPQHLQHEHSTGNGTQSNGHQGNSHQSNSHQSNGGHLEPPKTPPRKQTDKDGANLLMYLATSPSPAQRSTFAAPSSHGKSVNNMASSPFPKTPQQNFNFNDYLNIMTPSPAAAAGGSHSGQIPRTAQTPHGGPRRRLFED